MKAPPGLTAFFDTAQLYNHLTDEEKELVEHSRWEPAPHPFAWTGTRKLRPCGFGTMPGGEVLPLNELPEWSPEKLYQFPMVWINPVTGEKGLHIHCDVVRKLYFKLSVDGPERVVEDREEIRTWLNSIVDRICRPEYIAIPPYAEGDLLLFNNWVIWKPILTPTISLLTHTFFFLNYYSRESCIAPSIILPAMDRD